MKAHFPRLSISRQSQSQPEPAPSEPDEPAEDMARHTVELVGMPPRGNEDPCFVSPYFIRTLPASRGTREPSELQQYAAKAYCVMPLDGSLVPCSALANAGVMQLPLPSTAPLSRPSPRRSSAVHRAPLPQRSASATDLTLAMPKPRSGSTYYIPPRNLSLPTNYFAPHDGEMVMPLILGPPVDGPAPHARPPAPPLTPSFLTPRQAPTPPSTVVSRGSVSHSPESGKSAEPAIRRKPLPAPRQHNVSFDHEVHFQTYSFSSASSSVYSSRSSVASNRSSVSSNASHDAGADKERRKSLSFAPLWQALPDADELATLDLGRGDLRASEQRRQRSASVGDRTAAVASAPPHVTSFFETDSDDDDVDPLSERRKGSMRDKLVRHSLSSSWLPGAAKNAARLSDPIRRRSKAFSWTPSRTKMSQAAE